MVRTRSRTLSEISRSTLKKGERVKSSQVHETFRLKKLKSKLNKQMQKSRNGNGKALVLSLFWRKYL